jgi:hypothetical protein
MFLVDARPNEINNRDVMARLTASAEAVAEHEAQGSLQHRFVGLLEAVGNAWNAKLMVRGNRTMFVLHAALAFTCRSGIRERCLLGPGGSVRLCSFLAAQGNI